MDEAGSFEVVAKELKVLGSRRGRGEPGSAVKSFWSSSCGCCCCCCWAEEEEDVVDDATWFVGPAEMNNMLCCFSVWLLLALLLRWLVSRFEMSCDDGFEGERR